MLIAMGDANINYHDDNMAIPRCLAAVISDKISDRVVTGRTGCERYSGS